MRIFALLVSVSMMLVGCSNPTNNHPPSNEPVVAEDSGVPSDFKLANPCPEGVPSVYQRPDGAYVVKDSGNHDQWIEIVQTPADFCKSYKG